MSDLEREVLWLADECIGEFVRKAHFMDKDEQEILKVLKKWAFFDFADAWEESLDDE